MKFLTIIFLFLLISFNSYSWDYEEVLGEYELTQKDNPTTTFLTIKMDGLSLVEQTDGKKVKCTGSGTMMLYSLLMSAINCDDGKYFEFSVTFYEVEDLSSFVAPVINTAVSGENSIETNFKRLKDFTQN